MHDYALNVKTAAGYEEESEAILNISRVLPDNVSALIEYPVNDEKAPGVDDPDNTVISLEVVAAF